MEGHENIRGLTSNIDFYFAGSIKYKFREETFVPFWSVNWCDDLPLANTFHIYSQLVIVKKFLWQYGC